MARKTETQGQKTVVVQETVVQETAAIGVVQETTPEEAQKEMIYARITGAASLGELMAEVRNLYWTLYKNPAIPTRLFPTWGTHKTWSKTHTMGLATESKPEYPYLLTELVTRSTVAAQGVALPTERVLSAIQLAAIRVLGKSETYPHQDLVKMSWDVARAEMSAAKAEAEKVAVEVPTIQALEV